MLTEAAIRDIVLGTVEKMVDGFVRVETEKLKMQDRHREAELDLQREELDFKREQMVVAAARERKDQTGGGSPGPNSRGVNDAIEEQKQRSRP